MLTKNNRTKTLVAGLFALACLQALPAAATLFSAVLPSSRSVEIGVTATAFATILNTADVDAENCSIAPVSVVDAGFFYQTTNSLTNEVTGSPNTPVTIPANSSQSFVIGMTPNSDFPAFNVAFNFTCSTGTAPSSPGINTLLLSGNSSPVADVVAVAVTLSQDGIANLPRDNIFGLVALATTNVGAAATITARPVDLAGLDGFLRICETNQDTSDCLEPLTEETTGLLGADETRTYSVFISAATRIFLDATNRRTAIEFVDEFGNVRGSTSVAIQGGGPSALTFFTDNIADQVLQNNCTECHVQGGTAQDTALVFQIDEITGYQENNFMVVGAYLNSSPENANMLINLPLGMNGHPQIIEQDSFVVSFLMEFIDLFNTE